MKQGTRGSKSRRIATSGDVEVSAYLEIARAKIGQKPLQQQASQRDLETLVIVDFGSQYSRLIARRVREMKVYCEIVPHSARWEDVKGLNPQGVILSGGPASVNEEGAPLAPSWIYDKQLPILGICYGMQILAHQLGGTVVSSSKREYGHAVLYHDSRENSIFTNLPPSAPVWMSHGDQIQSLPRGFRSLAYTDNSPIAAMGNDQGIIGLQFHPEVAHTAHGKIILENFLYKICGFQGLWTADNFVESAVKKIQEDVGQGRVICALSGGVDSTVVAALIHRAVPGQLTCIFVNNGLLRKQEAERVVDTFRRNLNLNLIDINAENRFLNRLKEVTDPEEKRRIVGEEFVQVFEEEAVKLGKVDFLAQGTLYPDIIESQTPENPASAKIKTHHNVGGLPKTMTFTLVEPLRYLFKDEVREVGISLGLPDEMIRRQPFPGPGLAIRIIGEVTKEKIDVLQDCDWIVMDEIKGSNLYQELWQSFAILTNTMSVGVTGDYRTYGYVVAIRAVTSEDAMTADWARLPYEILASISNRISNEIPKVNRVVFDITSKPPGTIEWE